VPHSVYVLRQEFPRRLRFRDAICVLEFAAGSFPGESVFRARNLTRPGVCEITSSRFGEFALAAILHRGFVVEDSTPAARLMDRLVERGYASKRPANRRDLH
jgi:hypothetical protein